MAYPSSQETAEIYQKSGLSQAALDVGIDLCPAAHDWTKGGIRSLEAIWAEVAIRQRKRKNCPQTGH